MSTDALRAFERTSPEADNAAYELIARLDPDYFENKKATRIIDGTGALCSLELESRCSFARFH